MTRPQPSTVLPSIGFACVCLGWPVKEFPHQGQRLPPGVSAFEQYGQGENAWPQLGHDEATGDTLCPQEGQGKSDMGGSLSLH
jgi:hypothetical protein